MSEIVINANLTGITRQQAAVDFFAEMEQQKKATSAERARVKAGAERIKKMLTFNF